MDSVLTVWIVYGWLRGSHASQVSPFVSFPPFVIQTLNLELSRYDLDPIASTAGSNNSVSTLSSVSVWLCGTHAFEVSRFDFLHLADVYSFEFDVSASPSTFNVSVRVVCRSDGWPRRHW